MSIAETAAPTGTENQEAPQVTAYEQEAMDQGWVPKEEFSGDEHKWVDAAEFLRRGELFKKIESQSSELKQVRRALDELKKHHSNVREVEYKRALDSLKKQKKEALIDGDADALIEVDERIELVKEQQKQLQNEIEDGEYEQETNTGETHPEFVSWTNRNSWYKSNAPMRAFADELGRELRSKGKSPSDILVEVEKQVRKEFPQRFNNPKRDQAGAVEGAAPRGSSGTSHFELSADERRVMNTFVRQGVMTEKEYVAELRKVRGA